MAISTAETHLGYASIPSGTSAPTTYTAVSIKNFSDLGGEPETLETTDLSAKKFRTYIAGLQDLSNLTFTANWDKSVFADLLDTSKAAGKKAWVIQFSDGSGFTWQGELTPYKTGGGVNEVNEMSLVITPNTELTFVKGTFTYNESAGTVSYSASL